MDNIVLKNISVDKNKVYYQFEVDGDSRHFFKGNTIFFIFQEDVSEVPLSILTIPFIGAIHSLTWLNGSFLWVPEIDRTFYLSLRQVKQSFQEMHYDYPFTGKIVPSKIVDNKIHISEKALLLFGGGVDAHCTFLRNKEIISSIINVQGWYESINSIDNAANDDFDHCKHFAESHDIVFHYVKSNFASIINNKYISKNYQKKLHDGWWHGFQHSQAFITTAIVLCFKYGISNIYIGSSNTVGDQVACASDITTDSMFEFAQNGRVFHDAFELNRQQKIKTIVDYQKLSGKPYPLKVCSFNDHNCCECEKCFRTIIEIVAEGGNVKDFAFNIKKPLKLHFEEVMYRRLGLWGMDFERKIYWESTMMRMKENYANIKDKDFVDWFLCFDFEKAKREGLRRYYRQNFFSILKRKLHL